jgi:hypothetical protein
LTETPFDLATQRVERAVQRFQDSWSKNSSSDSISRNLDDLDVAVELWLDMREAAESEESVS